MKATKYFLAPYEWYNSAIANWTASLGAKLINFTPGTGTNADYTTPDMQNYKSSQELYDRLKEFESTDPKGLRGALILIHPGTHPDRTDKFYLKLEEIISKNILYEPEKTKEDKGPSVCCSGDSCGCKC